MKVTRELAARIASWMVPGSIEQIRDEVDFKTGGELDCFQLDLLTSWVQQELDATAAR